MRVLGDFRVSDVLSPVLEEVAERIRLALNDDVHEADAYAGNDFIHHQFVNIAKFVKQLVLRCIKINFTEKDIILQLFSKSHPKIPL